MSTRIDERDYPVPDDFVPVERRWLGLDKRSMLPAFVVVVLAVVIQGVLPAVNDAISWDDPVAAGDVIDLGDGVTFVPPVGWELEDGIRVGDSGATTPRLARSDAVVANGSVAVSVHSAPFSGTPDALLDTVDTLADFVGAEGFVASGDRASLTTDGGTTGVVEGYTANNAEGLIAAFVVPAPGDPGGPTYGITVTVRASPGGLADSRDDVDRLLRSFRLEAAT